MENKEIEQPEKQERTPYQKCLIEWFTKIRQSADDIHEQGIIRDKASKANIYHILSRKEGEFSEEHYRLHIISQREADKLDDMLKAHNNLVDDSINALKPLEKLESLDPILKPRGF